MRKSAVVWILLALVAGAWLTGCGNQVMPLIPPHGLPQGSESEGQSMLRQEQMAVGGISLQVEVARTFEEKARGLSGREGLADGTGMLFVFDQPSMPSFWMKEMRFGLDLIWIRDGRVVDISANVPYPDPITPLAQLPTYSPREPATHILEVPAGWAEMNGVAVGSEAIISGY